MNWYEIGRAQGIATLDARAAPAHLAAENLSFEQVRAWIDGVLDGVAAGDHQVEGIRVSHALFDAMRGIKDEGSDNFYRGSPFVGAERLWPENQVEVVLLGSEGD